MGVGPYPEISLKLARERALAARRLKVDLVDPIEARRAERAAVLPSPPKITFEVMAEKFILSKESGWRHRGKTADQWRASFRDWAFPLIGPKPVANIDTGDVMAVLCQPVKVGKGEERFWEARSETASRDRGRIENVLDFAQGSR